MVFSKLDCKPCWRERLPEIEVPYARRPRPPRPILPRRQRRGDRARDPRGAAARPRGGRHCDPRCGGRRGRRGDARARVEDGACRAAVGVGGSKRPRGRARARARRSALAEPSKRGSEESRQGRSGRLLHAVKERIEALWWHGNDQHGLSCDRSRTRTLKASPPVRRTYDAGGVSAPATSWRPILRSRPSTARPVEPVLPHPQRELRLATTTARALPVPGPRARQNGVQRAVSRCCNGRRRRIEGLGEVLVAWLKKGQRLGSNESAS